jgi:16S rRNA (guanine966-N2)-methyltransferase
MNALCSRGALDGAAVLDLYAGSGALGIEALSRGATHATFVDDDPRARRAIAENLERCDFAHRATVLADRIERLQAAWQAEDSRPVRYDLAFCDPPYAFDGWDELLEVLPAELVVVEAGAEVVPPAGWELVRSTRYGTTWIGFARRRPAER